MPEYFIAKELFDLLINVIEGRGRLDGEQVWQRESYGDIYYRLDTEIGSIMYDDDAHADTIIIPGFCYYFCSKE